MPIMCWDINVCSLNLTHLQARRVLDAIAVERARAALLVEELSGREEALTALLARAQHASTLQVGRVGPGFCTC